MSGGFTRASKLAKYDKADVLMTDSIYNNKVPDAAKGKLFHYKVKTYDDKEETFTLTYQKKAINEDAEDVEFTAFDENTKDITLEAISLQLQDVKDGQIGYLNVVNKTKKAKNERDAKVREELERESRDVTKVDLSDIKKILDIDHQDGGKSNDILLLEFEEVVHEDNDDSKKRRWVHKSTGREFCVLNYMCIICVCTVGYDK
jgi:hypothetical protein